METSLANLSAELAQAVENASRAVVTVQGRPEAAASGVLWRPGVVITTHHAVKRDEDLSVILPDGSIAEAELAGRDPGTDLAVLQTSAANGQALEPAAAELLKIGTLTLTVGRQRETGITASMGIVGALGGAWRTWRGGKLDRFIRLDVGGYPGFSGGAVVDTEGKLLGVATSGLSRVFGMVIPASTVERVAGELLRLGRVARGYVGAGLYPVALPQALRAQHEPDARGGLLVLSVEPDGPAEKAGLMVGDIVVRLGNQPVTDTDDVRAVLDGGVIGQSLELAVFRGGEKQALTVRVEERPGGGGK